MKINKTTICAHLALFLVAGAITAAAQGTSVPAGRATNFLDWTESFDGSTGSSGQDTALTSVVTYHLGRFSVGAGLPLYLDRSVSTSGATISEGIGDAFAMLGSSGRTLGFNYGTVLTGSAPTGNPDKGFGSGHATFDLTSHIDHDFGLLAPFVNAGVADHVTDTPFFHRPFTTYGFLAHVEGGADVDLSHSFTLTLSAYEIAPWGTQTIISRDVNFGATGTGGQHGRAWEVNHLTTGAASIVHDDGFTAGLTFSPKPYLDLSAGYTRSVAFAFNTYSWGIGLNMSTLISARNSPR